MYLGKSLQMAICFWLRTISFSFELSRTSSISPTPCAKQAVESERNTDEVLQVSVRGRVRVYLEDGQNGGRAASVDGKARTDV